MRKIALFIAAVLFIIPFFWLKPGFIDMGGDAGRMYFFDPLTVALNLFARQNFSQATSYAIIPYELFLAFIHTFITSPTYLIALDHGMRLSIAFLSIIFIVRDILRLSGEKSNKLDGWIGIASGFVYLACISGVGWTLSLPTLNQAFLNPLMFYLLFRFALNPSVFTAGSMLGLTLLYSVNFGFSSMPQLMAFYPMAIAFLAVIFRVVGRFFPWHKILVLGLFFIGLHAFHIIPTAAVLFDRTTDTHMYVFSSQTIGYSGVHYFDANHAALGKISTQVFTPPTPNSTIFVILIPLIMLLGFAAKPSKLQTVLGVFFATSLFLVSANITHIGVFIYQKLFYIPGFMMFRSFNEKWYFVFIFFYTLVFAVSLKLILTKRNMLVSTVIIGSVIISIVYRLSPFLLGEGIRIPHYQSKNVSTIFTIDPNLVDVLTFVKNLKGGGRILTLPLTFPNYQIAYGKDGGAYVGVSMVSALAGKEDITGFWGFGPYAQKMFDAIHDRDVGAMLTILARLNVRYVFYNSDTRIMDNFPEYPYIYPGLMYSSKNQLPAIRDQASYQSFLALFPLKIIYQKGFYTVYEIAYTHPPVYEKTPVTPPKEKKFFTFGLNISLISLGIGVVLISRRLYWRKRETS